ncbi:MAG: hypothetical protein JW917_00175 [Ignavibacteria bacterium]|nr:hypothetical protein [Ignavibacteria bacterium]
MKKLILFVLLAFSIILFTCGDDSTTNTPVTPNVETEASTVRVECELEKMCTDAVLLLIKVHRNLPITSVICPVITHNQSAKKIIVDYGNVPCLSGSNLTRRKGKYEINYEHIFQNDSLTAKITFTDFHIYRSIDTNDSFNVLFSGFDDIICKMIDSSTYRLYFYLKNNFNRSYYSYESTDILINGIVDIGDLGTWGDDVFLLTGSGSILNGNSLFGYNIFDSGNPIKIQDNCKYPLSGLIKLTSSYQDMIVDYFPNTGYCDDIITIRNNNTIDTVYLSSKF